MIDVSVDISGIVMYCDESILGLNIGHGYTLCKQYLNELTYREKITDARGNLNIEYMGSRLLDENGVYFICLNKHDTFQIDGIDIVPNVAIPITGPMCSEQLVPYQEMELSYLYEFFSLLHLFKQGNIGYCNIFFDYSYKTLGIMNNNVHNNSHSRSRNIVDQRKYSLTSDEIAECNQFLSDYRGTSFDLLKSSIDEFIWGIEQIDVPTGFEQYTTALEMILLETDAQGKKQKLANRVSALLGSSDAEISALHDKMLDYYRFRSESLHEGDGSNITDVELKELEAISRGVVKATLIRCKSEIANDPAITWNIIKDKIINDLIARVLTLKTTGVLPA